MNDKTSDSLGVPVYLCLSKLPPVPMSKHRGSSADDLCVAELLGNPDSAEDEYGKASWWTFNAHWSLSIRGEYFEIKREGLKMQFVPGDTSKKDVFYKAKMGLTKLSNEQVKDTGKSHIRSGIYDLLSRNCQTTTKDLARRIIGEDDWDPEFEWPLDSVDVLFMVVFCAAAVGVSVLGYKWAMSSLNNMLNDVLKAVAFKINEWAQFLDPSFVEWVPDKIELTGSHIISASFAVAKEAAKFCWWTGELVVGSLPTILEVCKRLLYFCWNMSTNPEAHPEMAAVCRRFFGGLEKDFAQILTYGTFVLAAGGVVGGVALAIPLVSGLASGMASLVPSAVYRIHYGKGGPWTFRLQFW